LAFVLAVQAAGVRHRYITPRRPQQNGKVERNHRIDDEEFWHRHDFDGFRDAEPSYVSGSAATTTSAFRSHSMAESQAEKLRHKQEVAAERVVLAAFMGSASELTSNEP
jgi:transposase InsO family protein